MTGDRDTTASINTQKLPGDWAVDHLGWPSGSVRNDRYEISVKISPKYRASASQQVGKAQNPTHFNVTVVQDWFSRGVYGDHNLDSKVETWTEAVETAMTFIGNFSENRNRVPDDKVEEAHRAGGDAEGAESILTSEATTEALADTVSYSDELLLDILEGETNGQYRVVAHRYGDEVEYIAGSDDNSLEEVPLKRIYGAFPIDKSGVTSLLSEDTILTVAVTLPKFTVYRFIVDDWRETNIILDAGTQVVKPVFEQNIKNILRQKWESHI